MSEPWISIISSCAGAFLATIGALLVMWRTNISNKSIYESSRKIDYCDQLIELSTRYSALLQDHYYKISKHEKVDDTEVNAIALKLHIRLKQEKHFKEVFDKYEITTAAYIDEQVDPDKFVEITRDMLNSLQVNVEKFLK